MEKGQRATVGGKEKNERGRLSEGKPREGEFTGKAKRGQQRN